jgi:hypothetical protein
MTVMDAKLARHWDTSGMRAGLTRSSLAVLLLATFVTVGTAHASTTIGADGFLSPDHKTWCSGTASEIGCVSFKGSIADGAGHGAIVKRGGKIVLCPESTAGPAWACFQNFDETAPVLHYGESTEVGGFRCKSTRQGITCLVRKSGRGFRVDRTAVTAIRG